MNPTERLKLFFFIALRDGFITPAAVERIISEHVEHAQFKDGITYVPEARTLEGYAGELMKRVLGPKVVEAMATPPAPAPVKLNRKSRRA